MCPLLLLATFRRSAVAAVTAPPFTSGAIQMNVPPGFTDTMSVTSAAHADPAVRGRAADLHVVGVGGDAWMMSALILVKVSVTPNALVSVPARSRFSLELAVMVRRS
jgi:hypothetical protein